MVKRVGRYDVGRTLGEGTFGKVKYAVNTETGEKARFRHRAHLLADLVPVAGMKCCLFHHNAV